MEKPVDGNNLPAEVGNRIIDKPELPPQGVTTDNEVYTEVVLGKGQLKRGSAYTTLQRMEDRGLIKSELKDGAAGDLPRRLHRITGLGQTSYQNALASHGLVQATAMGMNGAFTV